MIRRIITLLTLLVVISSCKAQGNNNIKQNKTLERTTERFDTSTYYMERQGHEYQFEHYLRGKVRQFGGDNGSNYILKFPTPSNTVFLISLCLSSPIFIDF